MKTPVAIDRGKEESVAEETQKATLFDRLIEKIKERIIEIKEEIDQLISIGDKVSLERVKALQVEITILIGQIIKLMELKAENEEAKS